MKRSKTSRLWLFFGLLLGLGAAATARAHEPFDISTRITVRADRLELTSTLGTDVVRQWLSGAGVPAEKIAGTLRAFSPDTVVEHEPRIAPGLFQLEVRGQPIAATRVTSTSEGMEIIFTLVYPRPEAGVLDVIAACYATVPELRHGALVIADEVKGTLGATLLSSTNTRLSALLPAVDGAAPATTDGVRPVDTDAGGGDAAPAGVPFATFFALGVEHILIGIDHLLFLGALLLGVRRLPGMLGVITCFTLAHSVTLALAALDVAVLPSRVVEPLIAASIILVCVDNFVRREEERDRWWLAGTFGLIHGFGFASVLRETGLAGSGGLVIPLVGFNLGVEAGQLLVAGVFLPLLFWTRRWPGWTRLGAPAASAAIVAVSSYWLWQRVFAG